MGGPKSLKINPQPVNLETLRVTVPEIWAGQNRGGKKRKKKKKKKRKRKRKKNEHGQNYIASPTGIANNEWEAQSH